MMSSKEGVQKGDPLGPLLFSLIIQKLIAAINARCPGLAPNLWIWMMVLLRGAQQTWLRRWR